MRALKEEVVISDLEPCSVELQNYMQILESELPKLNRQERTAIYLRFWVPCTIAQVATELKVSWEAADAIIDMAVLKLRNGIRERKLSKNYNSEEA